ncbi:HET-domain-containing protein, partial [Viridothelium virens]
MAKDQYSYDFCRLRNPAKQLRILKINGGGIAIEHPIECELVQRESKGGRNEYVALSWCWGSRDQIDKETSIRITYNNKNYAFPVPETLLSALKVLRLFEITEVWVDAICIDQQNVDEKNNQVPLMSMIYGEAKSVYIWLGEDEGDGPDGKMAFNFIKKGILNLQSFDHLVKDTPPKDEWNSVKQLMTRDYFSRRWIVQEVALAKQAVLLYGENQITWLDFADAISLFNSVETRTRILSENMKSVRDFGHVPEFFGDVEALPATRLVEVTNNIFRRHSDGKREALLSLEFLVSTFTAFRSSEARDTIYALLAIARDTSPQTSMHKVLDAAKMENFKDMRHAYRLFKFVVGHLEERTATRAYRVDYNRPTSDVFVDFVDFAIRHSDGPNDLDILCRPWVPDPDDLRDKKIDIGNKKGCYDTLPSWIRSSSHAAYGLEILGSKMARQNADVLVGVPPQRHYAAAGTTRRVTKELRFEDGIINEPDNPEIHETRYHSVFVEGFKLDRVKKLGPASQKGVIPKEWKSMLRAYQNETFKNTQDFWRILVADRNASGNNPGRFFPRLLEFAYDQQATRAARNETLDTSHIINYGTCEPVKDLMKRIKSMIYNRKLVRTQNDRFGLVPDATEDGDFICILYGSSVPVVMR